MAESLQLFSIIAFVAAGVFFVLAVFLWFFFKIPNVIGDLSGRLARKSIAEIRAANERAGKKTHKSSEVNAERGKITEAMLGENTDTGKLPKTGLLPQNKTGGNVSDETGVLNSNLITQDLNPTGKLDLEETGLLAEENNGTECLDTVEFVDKTRTVSKKLEIIEEVMITHTDEVI